MVVRSFSYDLALRPKSVFLHSPFWLDGGPRVENMQVICRTTAGSHNEWRPLDKASMNRTELWNIVYRDGEWFLLVDVTHLIQSVNEGFVYYLYSFGM
jgi:hypothetical protein